MHSKDTDQTVNKSFYLFISVINYNHQANQSGSILINVLNFFTIMIRSLATDLPQLGDMPASEHLSLGTQNPSWHIGMTHSPVVTNKIK